jgi:putative hydrolase of HD superfamily
MKSMQKQTSVLLDFFKYQNQLKMVFRNNQNQEGRRESSAEHTWSVTMMAWLLTKPLEQELGVSLDQNRILKMALVHDLVEIDAGDVAAWDKSGRAAVAASEQAAIAAISEKLAGSNEELYPLWMEHDALETIESKLVKACDQLCPLIYRVVFHNSYQGSGVDRAKLDGIFLPIVAFSQVTTELYTALAEELEQQGLFDTKEE